MPITLAQAQVNTINDIDFNVIDDFRRNSWLMDNITFDDTSTPATGGSSLGYTYVRKSTGASAAPRPFNTEYVPSQATRATYSVALKPMGSSFELDRTLANIGPAATNETTFQMMEAMIAVRERFVREFLYGDTAVDAATFDGLSKALTGTSTELSTATNWATVATAVNAMLEFDKIDLWLAKMVASKVGSMTPGQPGAVPAGVRALLFNSVSLAQFRRMARFANLTTMTKDNFDQDIESYRGWRLIDLGDRADGTNPIIPITANVSEVFAVSLGLDAAHAASAAGAPLVRTYLPDFSTAGAVKLGEVELGPAAFVLRSTRCCGVYRSITVQ
jgi:hypothetical protein